MKPLLHAKISAKKFGGKWENYIEIHNWLDQTKGHIPDSRHRMVLHNSFGIMLCEQQFGVYIVNSSGKDVSVRDIAEHHVIDDLGYIPTLFEVFQDVAPPSDIVGGKIMAKINAGNFVLVD
jgi:hypothetical protein